MRLPIQVIKGGTPLNGESDIPMDWSGHALQIRERLQKAHEVARRNLSICAKHRKDFYNNKVNFTPYHVYDKVWYLDET